MVWFACFSPVLTHRLALFSNQLFPLLWWGAHWSTQSYCQHSALGEAYVPASSFLHSYYLLKGEFPSCHLGRQWSWEPGQMSGCPRRNLSRHGPGSWTFLKRMWVDKQPCGFLQGVGISCPEPLSGTSSKWEGERLLGELPLKWEAAAPGVVRGPERVIGTSLFFVPLPVGNATWTLCDISWNPFCVHTTSHIYVFNTDWFQNTLVNYTAIWNQVLFQNIFRVKIFEWYDAFMVWRIQKKKSAQGPFGMFWVLI